MSKTGCPFFVLIGKDLLKWSPYRRWCIDEQGITCFRLIALLTAVRMPAGEFRSDAACMMCHDWWTLNSDLMPHTLWQQCLPLSLFFLFHLQPKQIRAALCAFIRSVSMGRLIMKPSPILVSTYELVAEWCSMSWKQSLPYLVRWKYPRNAPKFQYWWWWHCYLLFTSVVTFLRR